MRPSAHDDDPAPAPPAGAALRARLASGLGWKAGGQVTLQLVRIATTVVLARLLTPDDVGLAAVAIAVTALAGPFADLALGPALVQRERLTEADRSTVFWVNVASGTGLAALGAALAVPIAALCGRDEIAPLLAVLSTTFVLSGLGAAHAALLVRDMRFGALEAASVAATLAGAAAAVALAASGAGPWALIAQPVAGAVVNVALVWILSPWRPRRLVDRASLRSLGGFGARLLAVRTLFTLHRNADNLLVGGVLGSTALGLYGMAYNLAVLPFARVVDPLRELLFPALARLQADPRRVAAAWMRATQIVVTLLSPALAALAVCGDDAVRVVLGGRWDGAATPLRILAVVGVLQAATSFNSVVLPALDRTAQLLRFAVLTAALSIGCFAAGLPFDVTGVAAGYLVANLVLVPVYTRLVARSVQLPLPVVLRALAGPAALTALVTGAALAARLTAEALGAGATARLTATGAAALAAWLAATPVLGPALVAEVRRLLAGRRPAVAAG